MTDTKREARVPYPPVPDHAAQLAVNAAERKLRAAGAFDEYELSASARVFGKACALQAVENLVEAYRSEIADSERTPLNDGLLSFADAETAGKAMHDTWEAQTASTPPFDRDDAAWSHLFRVGYDAVRSLERT